MMIYGLYSKYYNLVYQDKDYAGEARYVHDLIQKHRPGATSILNLGCGTGNHDFELAKLGYEVTGIDMSSDMLAEADRRLSTRGAPSSVAFIHGDIRTVRLQKTFDVVVSLFHVMSYQTTDCALNAVFTTAKAHLEPEGLFLFDCWYGPAVLTDPPVVRVKRIEDREIGVVRIAEPTMDYNRNVVEVKYQMFVSDKATGTVEEFAEVHSMRYLFMPEAAAYHDASGFKILQAAEWLTGKEPGSATWGVCFVGASYV